VAYTAGIVESLLPPLLPQGVLRIINVHVPGIWERSRDDLIPSNSPLKKLNNDRIGYAIPWRRLFDVCVTQKLNAKFSGGSVVFWGALYLLYWNRDKPAHSTAATQALAIAHGPIISNVR